MSKAKVIDGEEVTETVTEKIEKLIEPVVTAVVQALSSDKKITIVRYFQLHPMQDKTLERTIKKLYAKEVHTEKEWEVVIDDFLYN